MLRRQVIRPLRKPLIVFTPKSLLRLPAATSSLDELAQGRFQRILADPNAPPADRVDRDGRADPAPAGPGALSSLPPVGAGEHEPATTRFVRIEDGTLESGHHARDTAPGP
jgi:hypothetical protein